MRTIPYQMEPDCPVETIYETTQNKEGPGSTAQELHGSFGTLLCFHQGQIRQNQPGFMKAVKSDIMCYQIIYRFKCLGSNIYQTQCNCHIFLTRNSICSFNSNSIICDFHFSLSKFGCIVKKGLGQRTDTVSTINYMETISLKIWHPGYLKLDPKRATGLVKGC